MQDESDIPDKDSLLTAAAGEPLAGPRPAGERGKWTAAIAVSFLVHGAAAAAFLISPGSKANLADPAQAVGSDRSGADIAGSALNPEQEALNVALVPPPRPPAKPTQPAEAAPPVEATKGQPEPEKPPTDLDILVANAPRNDADSVAPETKPPEHSPAQQQQTLSHPPTPALPPVPTARPASANPRQTSEKSGAADGQDRPERVASKGKRQNEVGAAAEDNYRSGVIRKLGRVYRAVPPSLQATARSNTVVTFVIGRQGTIDDLRVVESSGSETFDQIVLGFVRKAAPFPPIPDKVGNRLEFTGAIGPF